MKKKKREKGTKRKINVSRRDTKIIKTASTYMDVFVTTATPDYEACERRMSKVSPLSLSLEPLSLSPSVTDSHPPSLQRMAELAERHRSALETSRQFYASRHPRVHPNPNSTSNPLSPLPPLLQPLPSAGEPAAASLYGFAVVGCIVALVTLNTGKLEAQTRTLHVMDYRDPGMDVWNAVAVALMVTQARDEQMVRVEWGRKIACDMGGLEDY